MQIILEETEILEALNNYCANQIKVPEGKRIKVDFVAGRGNNSNTRAIIEFEDINDMPQDNKTPLIKEPKTEKQKGVKPKEPEKVVEEIIKDAAKEPTDTPFLTEDKPDPAPEIKIGESLFNF